MNIYLIQFGIAIFLLLVCLSIILSFKNRKKKKEIIPEGWDEKESPEPYVQGPVTKALPDRVRDFVLQNFKRYPLTVIRFRKDRRQDHRVFVPRKEDQDTLTWGNETYDVEEDAIIHDFGKPVMYVVQGCRKPLSPFSYLSACLQTADSENKKISDADLVKFGKINISSRDAFVKMNNRDAEKIAIASQLDYVKYGMFASIGALIVAFLVLACLQGWIPSTLMENMVGMKNFLIQSAEKLENAGVLVK